MSLTERAYRSLFRPALFRLDADSAHDLAKAALATGAVAAAGAPTEPDPRLRTDLAGLSLKTPIGLAPGFDKSGDLVPSLARLGFGYVVVGS